MEEGSLVAVALSFCWHTTDDKNFFSQKGVINFRPKKHSGFLGTEKNLRRVFVEGIFGEKKTREEKETLGKGPSFVCHFLPLLYKQKKHIVFSPKKHMPFSLPFFILKFGAFAAAFIHHVVFASDQRFLMHMHSVRDGLFRRHFTDTRLSRPH